MVSFGFKRSCSSLGSPSAAYPGALAPIEMGRRYELGGAPFRTRWGTVTTEGLKVPHFASKPRPTSVVIAPHFPSESVPHFARNPHPDKEGYSIRPIACFDEPSSSFSRVKSIET
jgi:hypothetical protein